MKYQYRGRLRDEMVDRDTWLQPGFTASLLLNSVIWVLWWVASLMVGPIQLATSRERDGLMDDVTSPEDRRCV